MAFEWDHKEEDELRPEHEEGFWNDAVRGKYAERSAASARVVRLAPDVAMRFPDDESVNEALRLILSIGDATSRLAKRSVGAAKTSGDEGVE